MNKHLIRIAAFLLVPCLIADPVTVSAFLSPSPLCSTASPLALINQQAIVGRLRESFRPGGDIVAAWLVRLRPHLGYALPIVWFVSSGFSRNDVREALQKRDPHGVVTFFLACLTVGLFIIGIYFLFDFFHPNGSRRSGATPEKKPVDPLVRRQRAVYFTLAGVIVGLLILQFGLRVATGLDLWQLYLAIQRNGGAPSDVLSGLTAIVLGTGAQWAGMALSDTDTRRNRTIFVVTLLTQFIWRYILGWATSRYYGWVDHHFILSDPQSAGFLDLWGFHEQRL